MEARNSIVLEGQLAETEPLRHTPAGIPILKAVLRHESEQVEAGAARQVVIDVACVAVEEEARYLAAAPLGARVRLTGFLAAKGKSSRQLVLHVKQIEFSGDSNGNG